MNNKYENYNYVIGLLATSEGDEDFKFNTMKAFFEGKISYIDLITETYALIDKALIKDVDGYVQHKSTKECGII